MTKKDRLWSTQTMAADCQEVDCDPHHPYEDFRADPSGMYVLIRVNFEWYRLEVAVCDKNHEIQMIFRGRSAQDLYHTILSYEGEHNHVWFQRKDHIAYLGKELKKAEIALSLGHGGYYQE